MSVDPRFFRVAALCSFASAATTLQGTVDWNDLRQEIDSRATGLLLPYAAWTVLISIPYFIWAYQQFPAWWATRLLLADFYGQQLMVLPFSVSWFFTVMFIAVVVVLVNIIVDMLYVALDPRIKACVISGYFCDWRHSVLAMNHCTCNFIPGLMELGELSDLAGR